MNIFIPFWNSKKDLVKNLQSEGGKPRHLLFSLVPFEMSVHAARGFVIYHGPFKKHLNILNVEVQMWQFGGNITIQTAGYNYGRICRQPSEHTVCNEIYYSHTSQLHMAAGLPTCYTDSECREIHSIIWFGFLLRRVHRCKKYRCDLEDKLCFWNYLKHLCSHANTV